jgi:hypothetical protein
LGFIPSEERFCHGSIKHVRSAVRQMRAYIGLQL